MDLKTLMVTTQSDIGTFEGNGMELVVFLRERAITDLGRMLDTQLVYDREDFIDSGKTSVEDPFLQQYEDTFEKEPEESIALPDSQLPPQTYRDILDTQLGVKIAKFQSVISYFDNLIVTDGIIEVSNPEQAIINKFKELEGVYTTYGEFVVSTSFTTV